MSNEKYFNFPIELLERFLSNNEGYRTSDWKRKCLNKIMYYALYAHSLELEHGTDLEKLKSSCNFFNVTLGNPQLSLETGKQLYSNSIYDSSPKVGINLTIWWDFYNNEKTEFEMVCLLGFLAIKSILMDKAYCKITNNFWLARMDGKAKACDFDKLSPSIQKYANEYQTKKIKTELSLNWHLITYSRYTRGFFVSFKFDIVRLVHEVEKRRKSTKEKQLKLLEKEALAKAMKRLN